MDIDKKGMRFSHIKIIVIKAVALWDARVMLKRIQSCIFILYQKLAKRK